MTSSHRTRAHLGVRRRFTLLELAIAAVIVAVLAALLLSRIRFYQEQAEKAGTEQMLGILRSAAHLQIAALMARDNVFGMHRMADQNPMDWLGEKPGNYAGEYYTPKPGMVASGKWYFDRYNKNLVYVVTNTEHLHTAPGEANKLRFQVRLVNSSNGLGILDGVPNNGATRQNTVVGIVIVPAVPYQWF